MQDSLIVVALVELVAVVEYNNKEEEHHLCNYMKYMIARCKA